MVKPAGTGPIFNDESADVIFLCDVYEYLNKPKDYFERLRSSLKKSTGRLFIVYFNDDNDFSMDEFKSFGQVIRILVANGEDFPIFRRLRKNIQDFLVKKDRYYMVDTIKENEIPEDIKKGIIEDFNSMLYDRRLLGELINYYEPKESKNRILEYVNIYNQELAAWLIRYLDEHKVFDLETSDISSEDEKLLHKLNKIMIGGIFSTIPVYLSSDSIYYGKDKIISQLGQAGYNLVREYDILEYHYFLEFKRND